MPLPIISVENVSFRYDNAAGGSLTDVSLQIYPGECVLLCGQSGCGKTTLTRLLNGLIPHFYEGELSGKIIANGVDIGKTELPEISRQVGSVFQNPRSQFFCVDTTGEIAFGCENLGLPAEEIDQRVAEAAKDLDAENLLGRSIFNLSGGEKQKVACASVSAMRPEILVLDEPTSNLDPKAIRDLQKTVKRWKEQGKTIIIAEHRLHWLTDLCDRTIYMSNGQVERDLPMKEFRQLSENELSKMGLRTLSLETLQPPKPNTNPSNILHLKNYQFTYRNSSTPAMDISELGLPQGKIVAIIGHNGAGKSTLSKCLCGLEKRCKGHLDDGETKHTRRKMLKKSFMVMQDVNHQFFCESVEDELVLGLPNDTAETEITHLLDTLELSALRERHPMSLSGGQKQRVAIASAILARRDVLIFDEPTSGLDHHHMGKTAELLNSLRGNRTILIVTHDPELILRCCDHVIHVDQGTVADQYQLDDRGWSKLRHFFQ